MKTLAFLADVLAERNPGSTAIVAAGSNSSFSELAIASNRVGNVLFDAGVARGDRIGVLLKKGRRVAETMYGIWKAGAIYVPFAPSVPVAQIAAMVRSCEITHLVTETAFAKIVAELIQIEDLHVSFVLGLGQGHVDGPHSLSWDELSSADGGSPPNRRTIEHMPRTAPGQVDRRRLQREASTLETR